MEIKPWVYARYISQLGYIPNHLFLLFETEYVAHDIAQSALTFVILPPSLEASITPSLNCVLSNGCFTSILRTEKPSINNNKTKLVGAVR